MRADTFAPAGDSRRCVSGGFFDAERGRRKLFMARPAATKGAGNGAFRLGGWIPLPNSWPNCRPRYRRTPGGVSGFSRPQQEADDRSGLLTQRCARSLSLRRPEGSAARWGSKARRTSIEQPRYRFLIVATSRSGPSPDSRSRPSAMAVSSRSRDSSTWSACAARSAVPTEAAGSSFRATRRSPSGNRITSPIARPRYPDAGARPRTRCTSSGEVTPARQRRAPSPRSVRMPYWSATLRTSSTE